MSETSYEHTLNAMSDNITVRAHTAVNSIPEEDDNTYIVTPPCVSIEFPNDISPYADETTRIALNTEQAEKLIESLTTARNRLRYVES